MRRAKISRKTLETKIDLELALDGTAAVEVSTGIGFFDHLLKTMAYYAGFNLNLCCRGDLNVDTHHTAEDTGLCLGAALKEAVGDKAGIRRFASKILPMDESLVLVAVDISNRPFYAHNLSFEQERLGKMEAQSILEFLRAFAFSAGITLHISVLRGENDHHLAEAVFKALGQALSEAVCLVGSKILSTKGVL